MKHLEEKQKAELADKLHHHTIIGKTLIKTDFTFDSPNEQLCKLFGCTAADLKDKTIMEMSPPLMSEIDVANARMVMRGEIHGYILPKIYQFNSLKIYALISVLPIEKDGEFQCFYVEIMEITKSAYLTMTKELLRAHPALLASHQSCLVSLLSSIQGSSPIAVYKIAVRLTVFVLGILLALKENRDKILTLFFN